MKKARQLYMYVKALGVSVSMFAIGLNAKWEIERISISATLDFESIIHAIELYNKIVLCVLIVGS